MKLLICKNNKVILTESPCLPHLEAAETMFVVSKRMQTRRINLDILQLYFYTENKTKISHSRIFAFFAMIMSFRLRKIIIE